MIEQKSDEWHRQRLGKFTASKFADLLGAGRKKDEAWSLTAKTYIREVLAEILTGQWVAFSNTAMEWGIEHEDEAIKFYEDLVGYKVERNGFIELNPFVGGSPDGLINDDGIIEVKCPYTSAKHIETLASRKVPGEYVAQIQGNLLVTDRKWCDFISYDPRMIKDEHKIVVIRVERDPLFIEELKERLIDAVTYLEKMQLDIDGGIENGTKD